MKKYLYIGIVVLVLAGVGLWAYIANASDSGAISPGTMANDATTGTDAWVNVNNAKVSDDVYATFNQAGSGYEYSNYLNATNFGFTIPTGAVIDGILVGVEKKSDSYSFGIIDTYAKIIKADGTKGTGNKALVPPCEWTDTYASYGGAADLWGETWTAEDINDADFGFALSAYGKDTTAFVDHIRITVYYTTGGGGASTNPILYIGN